ncbi:protein of unknown function-containing protein [Forsythia ovata]|uniref:Uncharacterized protein n=1 Tax=Forsythia ovata TaxID=205694 RepID=A0ABD1WZ30_9LAMI
MAKIIITITFFCLFVFIADTLMESNVKKTKNIYHLNVYKNVDSVEECASDVARYYRVCNSVWGWQNETVGNGYSFQRCCQVAYGVSDNCSTEVRDHSIYYVKNMCRYVNASCLAPPKILPPPSPLVTPPMPQPPSFSPSPTPENPSPMPQPPTSSPSPTPEQPSPIPQPPTVSPSPTPEQPSPIPQPPTISPSPTPEKPSPIPQPPSFSPSPTPEQPSPIPQPPSFSPSPTPEQPSPISQPPSVSPSPTPEQPSPTPQPPSFSPSPTPEQPSPIPQPPSFSPSPTPEQPSPIPQPPSVSPPPTPEQPSPTPQPSPNQPTLAPSPIIMVPFFPFPRPNPVPSPLVPPPPPNHPIRSENCRTAFVDYDSCNPLPPDVSNASHMNSYELQFSPPYDNIDYRFDGDCCMATQIINNNCIDAIKDMSYGKLRIYNHLANICSFQISRRSKRS